MLPTEDAIAVGEQLQERFGLPVLADRNDARPMRTGSSCGSPGTRPDARRSSSSTGATTAPSTRRSGSSKAVACNRDRATSGPRSTLRVTTKIVEFNDVGALEAALAPGDVACVLAEPALTNIGIVAPDPGFHDAFREITRRTGTLLVIDETHTICVGPGGATACVGARSRLLRDRQADRGRHARRGVRHVGDPGDAARRRARRRRDRRERDRGHAHRQRARRSPRSAPPSTPRCSPTTSRA